MEHSDSDCLQRPRRSLKADPRSVCRSVVCAVEIEGCSARSMWTGTDRETEARVNSFGRKRTGAIPRNWKREGPAPTMKEGFGCAEPGQATGDVHIPPPPPSISSCAAIGTKG